MDRMDTPLLELAQEATRVRNLHNDPQRVSYVVDRNVNYTNVCIIRCSFCAFHRKPRDPQAYVLDRLELQSKAEETRALGGTGFLLQGGVNPQLDLPYFLDLLRFLSQDLKLQIHGFSPVEIRHLAQTSGLSLHETLNELREAGLSSLPGGGAEILSNEIRRRISPRKGRAEDWLEVMETAHELGMKTTATMMYGIGETWAHRMQHLEQVQAQQVRSLARSNGGGHMSFTCWPFQSRQTVYREKYPESTASEYLRMVATARIHLSAIPHIQASWVTMGLPIASLALDFGCDDMGSLMIEENVVSAAGTTFRTQKEELETRIHESGKTPWQRDALYQTIAPTSEIPKEQHP